MIIISILFKLLATKFLFKAIKFHQAIEAIHLNVFLLILCY